MNSNTFKTKARAIELLGRKQIRDDVTALIELMKNSYDADAERLTVEFYLETSDPYLIIYDTGHGMTESDLFTKWLVLGTDSKKREKAQQRVSKQKSRSLMGEKGIGRLASAALGEQFWMFTKSPAESWHGLYLNWNIFENPDLYLEDISIPIVSNQTSASVISNRTIKDLIQVQLENLNNSSWIDEFDIPHEKHKEIYYRIENQIKNQVFPKEHLEAIMDDLHEDKGQGTVIVIQFLRTRWNDVFNFHTDRDADSIAKQRYNRLASFVDTFSNLTNDFDIEIISDNQKLEFSHFIDETLYELYDVKIKGEIREGRFYGQLFALNADVDILNECNRELAYGIDVTAGLLNAVDKDCGPFKVEFCYFEQVEENSSLTRDQLNMLKERLRSVGGIKVFRDGVRVLPYGDVENDFLNLEYRRSKRAGYYLFSHRNMFGQIHLDSVKNPLLEDKSSREGLLENEQYYYFITSIQNLLYKIAVDFLGDMKKGAKNLRDSYLTYNRRTAENKKKASLALENEKKETEQAIKLLTEELRIGQSRLLNFENEAKEYVLPYPPDSLNYSKISGAYSQFKNVAEKQLRTLEQLKKDLEVSINPRFEPMINEGLLDEVYSFNKKKDQVLMEELERVSQLIEDAERAYERQFIDWHRITASLLNTDFDEYINQNRERVFSLESRIRNTATQIESQIEAISKQGVTKLQRLQGVHGKIDEIRKTLKEPVLKKKHELQKYLQEAESTLLSLKQIEPEQMSLQTERHSLLIRGLEERLGDFAHEGLQIIEREAERQVRQVIIGEVEALLQEMDYVPQDDRIIGELKARNVELERENEIFVDLANMGMAAEIVNHEFNQLFANVRDGLENIKITGLNATQKFWLQQIESGFKAISARHSQLSPMYRSYNLRKRPIKIYDLVNDMIKFFSGRLSHAHIQVQNQVDPDFELMLSPSKIYPAFSNLIDNAIYWLMDRQDKVLLFRSDVDNNCLYIEDSGPGINPRNSIRAFEPFFTQRRGGRGLGLSIVKKVLESQGHDIVIVQDVFEKTLAGACFKIKFSHKDQVN